MNFSTRQIAVSAISLVIAIAMALFILQNPARLGAEPLIIRALFLGLGIIFGLISIYPIVPLFSGRPGTYAAGVCLPVFVIVLVYYLYVLPAQAGEGFSVEQTQSQLITDSSSNGIIEVGFSYPIYTPTLVFSNHELFTRQVNVFLRMIDDENETAFFRAVRAEIPRAGLTVEATVQGMLSENSGFEFNPISLPPNRSVSGKVVFVISNLENGETFTQALEDASQAQFEIRDPESGDLLLQFPVTRM